jgi:hypothetical protein
LLEVGNVTSGPSTLDPLDPGSIRWVFLAPGGDGIWISDEQAQVARQLLEQVREQHFALPLVAPEAAENAPEFYVVAVADNLLLTQEQRVPGMTLSPLAPVLGDDIRVVLNELLQERGFQQPLDQEEWIQRLRWDRPAVLVECLVKAESPEAAATFSAEVIRRMLDLKTLRRGAAARLIAGVVGQKTGLDSYGVGHVWFEHSGYLGNLVGGPISGEDIHGLQREWTGLQANPRAQLWASLYADAVRDTRWDYQFFRCFTLLEAIADEVVSPKKTITDAAGNPRMLPNSKKDPYTTKHARGKVYELLMHMAAQDPKILLLRFVSQPVNTKAPEDQLWDEIGMWVQIRNDVAHEGAWQPPHPTEKPEHAAVRTALISLDLLGRFEVGARMIVLKIRDAVTTVLFAAIDGTL